MFVEWINVHSNTEEKTHVLLLYSILNCKCTKQECYEYSGEMSSIWDSEKTVLTHQDGGYEYRDWGNEDVLKI